MYLTLHFLFLRFRNIRAKILPQCFHAVSNENANAFADQFAVGIVEVTFFRLHSIWRRCLWKRKFRNYGRLREKSLSFFWSDEERRSRRPKTDKNVLRQNNSYKLFKCKTMTCKVMQQLFSVAFLIPSFPHSESHWLFKYSSGPKKNIEIWSRYF